LESLLDLCERDKYLIQIIKQYGIDRTGLKKIYKELLENGAGQWIKGHWVAASSLVFGGPLEYLLKNYNKKSWTDISWRLIEYFEQVETGSIK